MIEAVIFDMDGVIVDSEPLHHKAYQKMFSDFDLTVSKELYESFTGQATMSICERLCGTFNLDYEPQLLVNQKRKHFSLLFDEDHEFCLIEGVLDLIKDYHQSGLNLVLASSASPTPVSPVCISSKRAISALKREAGEVVCSGK